MGIDVILLVDLTFRDVEYSILAIFAIALKKVDLFFCTHTNLSLFQISFERKMRDTLEMEKELTKFEYILYFTIVKKFFFNPFYF